VGLLLLWTWAPRNLPEQGTVRLTFLDVGQGDAALVETSDGRAMLVDGGSASDSYDLGRMVVAPLLWDRGIRRLDVVVATHPQQDHVGGLAFVVDKFDVGEFWTNGMTREAVFLQRLETAINGRNVRVRSVSTQEGEMSLGECRVRILNPGLPPSVEAAGSSGRHLNNQSVMLHLRCGAATVLLTGDVERETEMGLTRQGAGLAATVLKVPHHGARGSVYEPFLRAVNPQVAVVSVGRANPYGHPSPAMLETYADLGIPILRTDLHGAITMVGTAAGLRVICESGRRLKQVRMGTEGWRQGGETQNFRRLVGGGTVCGATA